VTVHQCLYGRAPPYLSEHCVPVSSTDTRRHLRSANRHPLAVCRVCGSTLTAVGRSQLLVRWPGTRSRTLSCIPRAAQTVSGVYLKRTCSRDTSAPSALEVLNDYALYKSKHSLTQARQRAGGQQLEITSADAAIVHFIGLPSVRGPMQDNPLQSLQS